MGGGGWKQALGLFGGEISKYQEEKIGEKWNPVDPGWGKNGMT